MRPFTSLNVITMAIFICLCVAMQSSAKNGQGPRVARISKYRTGTADTPQTKQTKPVGVHSLAQEKRHNTGMPFTGTPRSKAVLRSRRGSGNTPSNGTTRLRLGKSASKGKAGNKLTASKMPTPTKQRRQNEQPTPEPTGDASIKTTVYADGSNAFALLLPQSAGEMVSEAEADGIAYCTDGSGCGNSFPSGFITGAAYSAAEDGSYVQITGCMDSSKFPFAGNDDGGQFDVRFPNGAQCTFGGYGASFIEQVEPAANRFCLRCCKSADDQQNCNSHEDRTGCPVAVPGTYTFGGIDCA